MFLKSRTIKPKDSSDPDILKLYDRIFPNGENDIGKGNYTDETTKFAKLEAEGFVYVADDLSSFKSVSTQLNSLDACQIQEVKIGSKTQFQGPAVKKKSRIRKVFNLR